MTSVVSSRTASQYLIGTLDRSIFGDAALGDTNLQMIATARSVGAAAKFTGSGGAIIALCPDGKQQEQRLQGKGVSRLV